MYSGMTRNEIRGILVLALLAALGVGARLFLTESPHADVWVERSVKQANALQKSSPVIPSAVATVSPVQSINASPITSSTTTYSPITSPPETPEYSDILPVNVEPPPATPTVTPGTDVAIPIPSPVKATRASVAKHSLPLATPLNLNTATLTELDTLPGIGPKTAQKILDYRTQHGEFHTVDDLINVSGIGPKTLEKLRPQVRVN
jgi:comEA protein